MKKEDAIRIIAEFMGYEINESAFFENVLFADHKVLGTEPTNYHESIDSLIPVWEKYFKEIDSCGAFKITRYPHKCYDKKWGFFEYHNCIGERSNSLQEVACICTAKAILELKL